MRVTTVTVEYGLTESMGDYNNIRPSVRLTAEMESLDMESEVMEAMFDQAKAAVWAQVDDALEAHGSAPKYDTHSPRFRLCQWRQGKIIAILPANVDVSEIHWLEDRGQPARLAAIQERARGYEELYRPDGYVFIDCSDGDLSPLLARIPPKDNPAKPYEVIDKNGNWTDESPNLDDENPDQDKSELPF